MTDIAMKSIPWDTEVSKRQHLDEGGLVCDVQLPGI